MPTVAIVEGVKIQLFAQEHPPPHFHAVFAEYRAQIDIASLEIYCLLGGFKRSFASRQTSGCDILGENQT
jgi:hypothetical protein